MRFFATVLAGCAMLAGAGRLHAADKPAGKPQAAGPTYILEIDALHTLAGDKIHQEIAVTEGGHFFVATQLKTVRWTFAGDVGQVVRGHLPVMLKSQCYYSPESKETSISPRLLEIDAKSTGFAGAIHGHGLSVSVRRARKTDQIAAPETMQKALEGMIDRKRVEDAEEAEEDKKVN